MGRWEGDTLVTDSTRFKRWSLDAPKIFTASWTEHWEFKQP